MKLAAAIIALLWQASGALAREPPPGPRVGDVYEIRSERVSTRQSADGSGSSHDRDSIVERVIAVRDGGVELEFDLAPDATAQDRAASWQFPVRVFRPSQGPLGPLAARFRSSLPGHRTARSSCSTAPSWKAGSTPGCGPRAGPGRYAGTGS